MDISKKRIATIIDRSVHYIYVTVLAPKLLSDESKRQELILNIILLFSISLIFLLEISIVYNSFSLPIYDSTVPLLIGGMLLSFFVIILILSRKGYVQFSTYCVIIVYFFSVTYGEISWGVALPGGLLGYAFIILMSGFLVNSRFSFKLSLLIVGILLALAYHESINQIVPKWKSYPTVFSSGVQYSIMLLLITSLSWLATSEIEKSLDRAKNSEKELKFERDQLEIRVTERTNELRKVQAEKVSQLYRFAEFGKLSSGLFHDLIGPLSTVASNIGSIEDVVHPDILPLKINLSNAVKASKRMDDFISAVKKQISTESFKEHFEVNYLIEEALRLFYYKASKAHITINFIANKKVNLFGYPVKFHQIITNLISNAVDATDNPDISAERREIYIILSAVDNAVKIQVKHQGIGVSKENKEKIFVPFFTTKTRHKGMGIGLSSTKEIVEKDFNGSITIENTPDTYTSFIVLIPIKQHEEKKES